MLFRYSIICVLVGLSLGAGQVISVTDEQGNPAKTLADGDMGIKLGDFHASIVDAAKGTTFVTKHNPNCRWVLIGNVWYYICG